MSEEKFPTEADHTLRKELAEIFLGAHRGWNGNEPTHHLIDDQTVAIMLAGIAVTFFHNRAFALSASVCEYRSGDGHGNPFCLMTNTGIGIGGVGTYGTPDQQNRIR